MAYDYVNFSCIPQFTYGTPGRYATLSDCENAVNDGTVKPVLILNPLWSASKKASLPLLTNKLGDGYQQIIFQGLNQINEEWSITSPVLLGSQVDELLNQLRAFCISSFLWSPNNGIIPYQEFTCEQWTKTRLGVNAYQIRGVFKMTVLGSGLLISGGGVPAPTDPNFANRLLLLHGDGSNNSTNFLDSSSFNRSVSGVGSPIISATQFKFNQSIYLNGSSFLQIPNSAAWAFGTGDFTFEGWVFFSSVSGEKGILSKFESISDGNHIGFVVRLSNSNSPAGFRVVLSNGSSEVFQRAWSPATNTWYFWQVIRQSGTLSAAINGVQLGSSQASSISLPQGAAPLRIGVTQTVGSSEFLGYMDEIRISNIAASIMLPTAPFPNS